MRSSDDPPSPSSYNGNAHPFPASNSRLDHSVLFSGYRSSSTDTPADGAASPLVSRSLYHASSLPDTGAASHERLSRAPHAIGGIGSVGGDAQPKVYDRFSFLLNSSSSSSTSGSLTGAEDLYSRISRGPLLNTHVNAGAASSSSSGTLGSPHRLLSPTGSLDLGRSNSFPASAADLQPFSMFGLPHGNGGMGPGAGVLGAPLLQRSFSSDGMMGGQQQQHQSPSSSLLFPAVHLGSHFQVPEPAEPEKSMAPKYRAFPDAYVSVVPSLKPVEHFVRQCFPKLSDLCFHPPVAADHLRV